MSKVLYILQCFTPRLKLIRRVSFGPCMFKERFSENSQIMGRGEYYKNKYGRGRGERSDHSHHCSHSNRDERGDAADHRHKKRETRESNKEGLRDMLLDRDRKPYNFYKDLYGYSFDFDGTFSLKFDHIQGDPYASASRICVTLPLRNSRFPDWSWSDTTRSVALADYICRKAAQAITDLRADHKTRGNWNEGKGGELRIEHPSQNILLRTSAEIQQENILLRFCVGLPAKGRAICGNWAGDICCNIVHQISTRACCGQPTDTEQVKRWVECYEDQEHLRAQLHAAEIIAFVPDGAVLARAAGHIDTPLKGTNVVAFNSPDSLKITLQCPNKGEVTGMGVKPGVTLIAGGGFHGKTTLLSALKMGVYSKVPGDGREYLVTTPTATKIRAEDGRHISGVDISNFINNLPQNKDTSQFYSCDASGSTSQAAAIMEYMELGGKCLMIDEDTAATNFMIRDDKIQMLLSPDKEPIKPFLHRARELFDKFGVSSIVVVGGAGDYLDIADTVLLLDNYTVLHVTERAKEIAAARPANIPTLPPMAPPKMRVPDTKSFYPFAGKTKVQDKTGISYTVKGEENSSMLHLAALEQIVEIGQTRFINEVLSKLSSEETQETLRETLLQLDSSIDKHGLGFVKDNSNWLSRARVFEIGAAINRYRHLALHK